MSSAPSKLFTPLQIGDISLAHRIVMAPMTRMKANNDFVLEDVTVQYYAQRSIVPGTLIISEAAIIAAEGMAFPNLPGIYNKAQIAAWRKARSPVIVYTLKCLHSRTEQVADAVHTNESYIYLQITAAGRVAYPELLHSQGFPYVSSSPVQLKSRPEVPAEMTELDIERYIKHYAQAARNVVQEAGLDGVEIHACNGGLVDQFIQDVVNKRTDKYGSSVEKRSRFALDVVEAVSKAVGEKRVGIRFSP
ncbi:hypothetical protein FRC10_010448 [Ceratobasidium sp. 414]|nr:hypothetical protein FRC10_010448 [Ceratobasidium sp. 414]